jgi:hypothetical protein
MIHNGTLLTQNEFLTLLGVDERRLVALIRAGSLFSIEVDEMQYFPAILCDPTHDRTRLHSICRMLVPAPPASRLDFLKSRQPALGGFAPVEVLGDAQLDRALRRLARAWAAQWSRTIVKVYLGRYLEVPAGVEPVHSAVDEVDPRVGLWKRGLGALRADGYIAAPRHFTQADEVTVFITRSDVGYVRTCRRRALV